MRRGGVIVILLGLWSGMMMSHALAHGDIAVSTPAANSTQRKVPRVVSVTFTETPTKGASEIEVRDGCKRDVTQGIILSGHAIRAAVGGARPGSWRVKYRILSAEDGHPSRGGYSFEVRGRPACNEEPSNGSDSSSEGDDGQGPSSSAGGQPPESDEGGLPWAAIAIGSLVLLGGAFFLRRSLG